MEKNKSWINHAIDLYVNHKYTYKKIAEIYGLNRKTVSNILRKNGVTSNPKYTREINCEKLRKYNYKVADNIFRKINTEEKAYWLGFLYADGYISEHSNTISLSLKEEDIEHIYKFRSFLGLEEKPIRAKRKNINNKIKISYEFSFNSFEAKECLIQLGCTPNKTFTLKFPTKNQVPGRLIQHFLRGYIDGDGCIYVHQNKISVEVLGTYSFLDGYKKWISLGNSRIYDIKNSKIKRVINSNLQAKQILNKIYKNASVFLERKYIKYLNFITPS